ncbi:phage tail protein [Jejudonia soesokkakensis]|uniref:Phage tail protein n=1 Tax=Jejudonia soesokkakensis TaxID=1323432 RepID=A0ABW2MTK8_9FLAO
MPSTPFVGQIMAVGFNFAPRGWAFCNGQLLAISQNDALFSLLGTIYGGDGRTTFGLPDLRGRSAIGIGTGPGLDAISVGDRGGVENRTNTNSNLVSHNHSGIFQISTDPGQGNTGNGQYIAAHSGAFSNNNTSGDLLSGVSINNSGGGQSYSIRNPYLAMHYCIALVGVYPSRN